jgi:hypothetical protein
VGYSVEVFACGSEVIQGKGTDPTITMQVKSTPGTTYTLQYSPDMTTGSWVDVGSATSNGTTTSFTESNSTVSGRHGVFIA